jgi:tight adherence protein B
MIVVTSLLFALMAIVLAVVVRSAFTRAVVDYRARFTEQARATLADLFLFVDSERLFRINLVLMALVALLVLALTGAWFPAVLSAVFLYFVPRVVYSFLRKRRIDTFVMQLPEALLSVAGAMKAGSSLVQGMETMVAETTGPIGQEFGLFLREVRVGITFDDALDNLLKRIPNDDLRLAISGMKISREIGGNLAETLERVADTLRRKLEMEGKIRALTAQGKLQGLVMTGLPIFLGVILYQMEPVHMSRLFTEFFGWATLTVVVVMEAIGYFFIRQIVNIDV